MTVIVSQSLYPVQAVERAFWHGNRYHAISAKVTLSFDEQGRLSEPQRQREFDLDEVWRERPMRSSLLRPGDLIPYKPHTDVLVIGTARPLGGRPAVQWDACLTFQGREKRIRLFGPRAWRHGLISGWALSPPEPTVGVPLLLENAYGGVVDPSKERFEEGEYCPDNPFGCGFVGRSRPDSNREYRAAQIEAWNGAIVRFGKDVPIGGFGPIPGFFPERAQHMGTWGSLEEQNPKSTIPLDMDLRYFNCAPPDQQCEKPLQPGNGIQLRGLTEAGVLELKIPHVTALAIAHRVDNATQSESLMLDTVLIDLDARELQLRYHGLRAVDPKDDRIRVICALSRLLNGDAHHG